MKIAKAMLLIGYYCTRHRTDCTALTALHTVPKKSSSLKSRKLRIFRHIKVKTSVVLKQINVLKQIVHSELRRNRDATNHACLFWDIVVSHLCKRGVPAAADVK